jgi:hypothetical protein
VGISDGDLLHSAIEIGSNAADYGWNRHSVGPYSHYTSRSGVKQKKKKNHKMKDERWDWYFGRETHRDIHWMRRTYPQRTNLNG